jgi:hypothetical protein
MKNIHILPTDKPSSLFEIDGHLIINKEQLIQPKYYRNIYITNDEDINENDYIITKDGRLVQVSYLLSKDLEGASKVILTTDHDLFKDDVQAINDEFHDWFVKNPSCESVETYSLGIENSDTGESGHYKYEIIIPQEEQTKCYCGHTSFCDCGPKEETFIKTDNVDGQWLSPVPTERAWQEEKLVEIFEHYPNASPKWQYMNGLIQNSLDAKQMYNEEDMIEFAVWMYLEVGSNKGKERTNKELFEQFKKEIKE